RPIGPICWTQRPDADRTSLLRIFREKSGRSATMSRSRKKGPYIDPKVAAKVEKAQAANNRDPIKTWARDCTIHPDFVGVTFLLHNGKQFLKVYVTEDMVGHKLGEFAPTRTFKGHSGGKAKAAAAAAAAAGGGK